MTGKRDTNTDRPFLGWTIDRTQKGWAACHPTLGCVEVKTREMAREYIRAYKRGEGQEVGDEAEATIARMRRASTNL